MGVSEGSLDKDANIPSQQTHSDPEPPLHMSIIGNSKSESSVASPMLTNGPEIALPAISTTGTDPGGSYGTFTRRLFTLDGAAIALILTAFAYSLAFGYERGYAEYWGIPFDFVAPSFTTIFTICSRLLNSSWGWLNMFSLIVLLISRRLSNPDSIWAFLPIIAIFFGPMLIWGFTEWKEWIMIPFLLVIIVLVLLSLACILLLLRKGYLYFRKRVTLRRSLVKNQGADASRIGYDMSERIKVRLGVHPASIITTFVLGSLLLSTAGQQEAATNVRYSLLSGDSQVVLRVYGETMICAKIDTGKRRVEPNFCVVKLSPEHPIALTYRTIGPLKVKGRKSFFDSFRDLFK